jgi:hypothetical protein
LRRIGFISIFVMMLLGADSVRAAEPSKAAPTVPAAKADQSDKPGKIKVKPKKFIEITPQMQEAVRKGLDYLARQQDKKDGSFTSSSYGRNVGITSLACLAFMANGNLPERGPHGEQVSKGLKFILNHAGEGSGLIAADTSHGPMYGHGFATLFLGEIYGMTGNRQTREALVKAVRLIVRTQNEEGGWRYRPEPYDADLSVTICQIKALRSARNAGLSVPKKTIERSIAYVRACQVSSDGGFQYMKGSGHSAFPRSAAGVASLYYAGVYEGDALKKGLAYLQEHKRFIRNQGVGHYWYGHYYAVQAMYMAGGDYWKQWYPAIREELLRQQESDGRWKSPHGDVYATAMALLILQVPNRYLPIFQRN